MGSLKACSKDGSVHIETLVAVHDKHPFMYDPIQFGYSFLTSYIDSYLFLKREAR